MNNKRIYELSHIGEIPKKMPIQVPLIHAAIVVQIGRDEKGAIRLLEETGHVPKNLAGIDRHHVLKRLEDAKVWVENFAPEQYRFQLNEDVKGVKVSSGQKAVLKEIAKILKEQKLSEKELHDKFYEVSKARGIEPKEFFAAAYKVLINKDKGPKLASFILTIGKEKAAEMFENIE